MLKYSTTKVAVLGAVALAFELAVLEHWTLGGGRAEALLALACFAALFARDSRQGLAASWVVGLIKDVGSTGPLGLYAFLFLGAGWVILQVRQILYREHALTQLAVAFVAACWVNVAAALVVSLTSGGIPFCVILGKTLLSAMLTALLTPAVLFFFHRFKWLVR